MTTLPTISPVSPVSPYLVVVSDPRSCPSPGNTLQFTHSASLLCPCVSQGSFLLCFALVQSSLVRPNSQFSTSRQRKSHSRVIAQRLYLSPCPDSSPMSPHSFLFTKSSHHSCDTWKDDSPLCSGTFGIYSSHVKGVKLPTNDEHMSPAALLQEI
jgi:hypothetical protein